MILRLIPLLLLFSIVKSRSPKLGALWNFERVTECVLHYTALDYNNYGCWCGYGGAHTPMDGIDACCRDHDHCYDAAVDNKKCYDIPVEYLDDYSWTCHNSTATCTAGQSDCQSAICACDIAVVNCWAQYPKPEKKVKCNHVDIFDRPLPT